MQSQNNIELENIKRMREIANLYSITGQKEKSKNYHEKIVELCNEKSNDEEILILKIQSLNYLNKRYKSLETTKNLLKINPKNMRGLINIITYLIG